MNRKIKSLSEQIFVEPVVNTGRQLELDMAKGFAIMFMVWVHIFEELSPTSHNIFVTFVDVLGGPFAAPVFMVCMGIGIVYSRHNTARDLFRRGLQLLVIGFVLNIARFVIPDILLYMITGKTSYLAETFSLFSVDILQFAGMAHLFFAFVKKLHIKAFPAFCISVILSIIGIVVCDTSSGSFAIDQFLGYIWGTDSRSYFPFLNWIIFPCFGMMFGEKYRHCKDKEKFYRIVFPWCLLIMLGYLGITIRFGLMFMSDGSYYHLRTIDALFFCILSILVFSLCHTLLRLVKKCSFHTLMRWSRNINQIYCIHWTMIGVLTIFVKGVFCLTELPFMVATVLAVVVLALSDFIADWYIKKKREHVADGGTVK